MLKAWEKQQIIPSGFKYTPEFPDSCTCVFSKGSVALLAPPAAAARRESPKSQSVGKNVAVVPRVISEQSRGVWYSVTVLFDLQKDVL